MEYKRGDFIYYTDKYNDKCWGIILSPNPKKNKKYIQVELVEDIYNENTRKIDYFLYNDIINFVKYHDIIKKDNGLKKEIKSWTEKSGCIYNDVGYWDGNESDNEDEIYYFDKGEIVRYNDVTA